jgi:hypothetical protein
MNKLLFFATLLALLAVHLLRGPLLATIFADDECRASHVGTEQIDQSPGRFP